jgi:hypothetical protein
MISIILALLVPCVDPPDSVETDPFFNKSQVNIIKIDGVYVGDMKQPTIIITSDSTFIIDVPDSCYIDSLIK